MTLAQADAIDSYGDVTRTENAQLTSDDYLARFHSGVPHLDAASWRHYLPQLADLALRRLDRGDMVVSALIQSLRPPDREPARLGSLSPHQESVVREVLEALAFEPRSQWQADACQALEEWWVPGALYRRGQASS